MGQAGAGNRDGQVQAKARRSGQMWAESRRVTDTEPGGPPPRSTATTLTDVGTTQVFLQARTRRVSCPEHGVVVAAVPWARPGSRFTVAFEDTTAWLVCHAALSVVAILLRVAWRSVSDIVARVVADRAGRTDRLYGLTRIGIDEISYRKGHRYLTVVVDHTSGRLVWAKQGRSKQTLEAFFDDLGDERSEALTHVSADGAEWIHSVVAKRAPQAVRCLDPFHLILWCGKAVDKVRRRTVAGSGHTQQRRHLMWAVRKNPATLSPDQRGALAESRTPTTVSMLPTCSKSNCARSSPPKANRARRCSPDGSPGRVTAAYRRWSHWPGPSTTTNP